MSQPTVVSPGAAVQQINHTTLDADPSHGCVDCNKQDFAILFATPLVLGSDQLTGEAAAKLLLNGPKSSLKHHGLIWRSLPTGYLYVYNGKTWNAWLVDSEGLMRATPPLLLPDDASTVPPLSKQCKRFGHNIPAQVVCFNPDIHPKIWVAFSRQKWSQSVLNAYAANQGGVRDKRMCLIDLVAASKGQLQAADKAGAPRIVKQVSRATLADTVISYASASMIESCNGKSWESVPNRSEQA
ncbi:MAG: hypothetical protein C4K60_03445 [Ideonella sp. MAG2]|nr:MAG: hypothetical protein C4K60_03445 [Ideonella sp. MAG2]